MMRRDARTPLAAAYTVSSRRVTDGCERLAGALKALAATHGLGDLRVVAVPFYHGEAAVFEALGEHWTSLYAYLDDVLGYIDQSVVNVRVDTKHGTLDFAVVPLTEEAADRLAAELDSHAQRRSEGSP